MDKIELLFEPEPFYNDKWDNILPTLDQTKQHFLCFIETYWSIGNILDANYSNSMQNFETFLKMKGNFVKTMTSSDYNNLGNYYHELRNYYSMLLNACRRRHNFWLNDILPDKYKTNSKNKKKKSAKK